jgi:hypothetical protein
MRSISVAFSSFPAVRGLRVAAASLAAFGLTALSSLAFADRPTSMKLFPEESLVFVRVTNASEFGEHVRQTATGRMIQDPQLRPFVDALYGKAGELYASEIQEKVGVSWEDLKKLPKGEVAIAVVARPEKQPALLLMIDQGTEPSVVGKLVDRVIELAEKEGGEISNEKIGDVEVTVVRDKDQENRMFGVCQREDTIIVATDPNVIRGVLWHWDHAGDTATAENATAGAAKETAVAPAAEIEKKDGGAAKSGEGKSAAQAAEFVPGRTLAQNERFVAIVKNCRRPQDPPPQLLFFVDPIELVRNVGRGNGGLQFALGLFPSLGLDGLMAVGGATTYATDEYDALGQFHVLLQNPRSGVLMLPAFHDGDVRPQPFVPLALETYITWNWNLRTTYDRLVALVDQYRYQGSVDKFVKEKISEKLGIDVPTQIIDNLKGRSTWMIGYDRPSKTTGQKHIFALELKDENAAKESLKTVMAKFPDLFEERHFGNVTYYSLMPKRMRERPDEERPMDPFVGVVDGYFFIGGSCMQFERCIAARDGTAPRMADSSDFARTSAVIGREMRGVTPVLFSIGRFEETLRQWYDLLTSEKTRALIENNKEKNRFLAALAEVMDQNKLPPFETLMQYAAPGGGILYDTDDGYHGISFSLRNETK